jgi:hypothetical protein
MRWQKNSSFGFSGFACAMAKTKCAICAAGFFFRMKHNGWRYVFVADFEALTCQVTQSLLDAETLKPALTRQ